MKTVIVTGAGGNMGEAIVTKFLDMGYFVVGTVLPNEKTNINDVRYERVSVDLLDEESANAFIAGLLERYDSIEALVATVGGFATGSIADTTTSQVNQQIQLNFSTTYNIVRPVFNQMMKQGQGRIFMTGSRPGLHSFHGNGMIAYSLGKSLLFRLADLLNDEAKGADVVASVIVPSTIDTPQNGKAMPAAKYSDWVKPSEIANIIYYHCSQDARPLRETIIKVYGNS